MKSHGISIKRRSLVRRANQVGPMIVLSAAMAACSANHGHESVRTATTESAEGASMSPEQAQSFVDRFTTAWRTRRNEDFAAIWHPHGRLVYPFASRVIRGNEIGVLNELTKKNAPNLTWRALGWTARGSTIVVEWESSNRYGDRTLTWRGMDKLSIEDGKIIEEVVYTDTAPFQALRRGEAFAPLIPFPDPAE